MKKSMLFISLAALLGTMDYALAASENGSETNPPATAPTAQEQPTESTKPVQPAAEIPAAATPAQPQKIDCNYHIPAETKSIEQPMVVEWATKAAEQSFDFEHSKLDSQLEQLKACFTKQGWESFSSALTKSGNLNAIRTEKLTVSSMSDGEATINVIEPNQWKINLPLNVVYQNDKEKLNQSLNIMLLVGRKTNGDLGILQLVAMPRDAGNAVNPQPQAPASTNSGEEAPATN